MVPVEMVAINAKINPIATTCLKNFIVFISVLKTLCFLTMSQRDFIELFLAIQYLLFWGDQITYPIFRLDHTWIFWILIILKIWQNIFCNLWRMIYCIWITFGWKDSTSLIQFPSMDGFRYVNLSKIYATNTRLTNIWQCGGLEKWQTNLPVLTKTHAFRKISRYFLRKQILSHIGHK